MKDKIKLLKKQNIIKKVKLLLNNMFGFDVYFYEISQNKDKLLIWSDVVRNKYGILPSFILKEEKQKLIIELNKLLNKYLSENLISFYDYSDEHIFEFKLPLNIFIKNSSKFFKLKGITGLFLDDKNNFIIFFDDENQLEVYIGKFINNKVKYIYPQLPHE